MQTRLKLLVIIFVVIVLGVGISTSYAEDSVSGHWEGHIEIPGQPLAVKVDLTFKDADWNGTIDIPVQGAKGLPLSEIHVEENGKGVSVTFSILRCAGKSDL